MGCQGCTAFPEHVRGQHPVSRNHTFDCLGAVGVFQPAVWILNGHAMQRLGEVLPANRRVLLRRDLEVAPGRACPMMKAQQL